MTVTSLSGHRDEQHYPVSNLNESRWAIRMCLRRVPMQHQAELESFARFLLIAVHGGMIGASDVGALAVAFLRGRVYDDEFA